MARWSVLTVLVLAVAAAPAAADRGVSLDLGRIEIEQRLTPGGSYRLPVFGVRNPGTEITSYRMGASAVESEDAEAPPESWFEFEPRQLTLKPGETRPVQARLVLPTDADPGDYVALVGAQIVTEGSGAQVGAAAAARTTFTVEPATTLQAWWLKLKTFLGDAAPWSWLVPALALLALLTFFVRKRFSLTVARRA
jgi:hypothetical protein